MEDLQMSIINQVLKDEDEEPTPGCSYQSSTEENSLPSSSYGDSLCELCILTSSKTHFVKNCPLYTLWGENSKPIAPEDNRMGLQVDDKVAELFLPFDKKEDTSNDTDWKKNKPSTPYVCHLCYTPGHNIKDCQMARDPTERFTPYQGPKRCLGEFTCQRCNRSWTSKFSWANTPQQCLKCKINVFPHKQKGIKIEEGEDTSPPPGVQVPTPPKAVTESLEKSSKKPPKNE